MKALDLYSMLVETMNKPDHVLIIGFGRGGQTIGRILAQENIPYYALNLDVERVRVARSADEPVSFGNAKRCEVLEVAELNRTKVVVIMLNNMRETQHVLDSIMSLHPTIPVYVRAVSDDYLKKFSDIGVEEAVSDIKETSFALASYVMLANGAPYTHVYRTITNIRRNRYASLEDLLVDSDDETSFSEEGKNISRHASPLAGEAYTISKTIQDLPLVGNGIKLLFVRRNTSRLGSLGPDFRLQAGDILVVAGRKEEIISFEDWSLQGNT